MAISRCGKCDNTFFELQEVSPMGARFKYYFIQCSNCGNVVSHTDYFNVPAELQFFRQDFDSLKRQVDEIEKKINYLVHGMEQILIRLIK